MRTAQLWLYAVMGLLLLLLDTPLGAEVCPFTSCEHCPAARVCQRCVAAPGVCLLRVAEPRVISRGPRPGAN